jgi:SpoVK/Ycf46/Vps4 family AAA+-type ATPase
VGTLAHVTEACRRQSGRRLLTFTQRVTVPPQVTIDNTLVLPRDQKDQLHALVDRVRYRHLLTERHPEEAWRRPKGVVALFAGSSGTGKTLAAGCVASELEKDLLRVDLPAVVSKWVGETEKNLQQVFAEAEDANAVMFFDEAESFFAKRGEVRGAQDRWAMMETDYLLQRMEGYTGAVILATNLRQQIDEAFLRRIDVAVEFPLPDAEQREQLWLRSLSRRFAGVAEQDIREQFSVGLLASKYSLSGAQIDAALSTADVAALASGSATLSFDMLMSALELELRKVGAALL